MRRYFLVIFTAFIIAAIAGFFVFPQLWTTIQYTPGKVHLVVEGGIAGDEDSPIVEDGQLLFSIDTMKKFVDPNVHWDEKANKVVFTTRDKVLIMKTGKITAMVNARPVDLNMPVKLVDGKPYIPIQMLDTMFGIEIRWIEENNVAVLDYVKNTVQVAEVQKDNRIMRAKPALWSPAVRKDIDRGEVLRVFGEDGKWYKVRSNDGFIGYIQKKYVKTDIDDFLRLLRCIHVSIAHCLCPMYGISVFTYVLQRTGGSLYFLQCTALTVFQQSVNSSGYYKGNFLMAYPHGNAYFLQVGFSTVCRLTYSQTLYFLMQPGAFNGFSHSDKSRIQIS
jgi:hypothetical protein